MREFLVARWLPRARLHFEADGPLRARQNCVPDSGRNVDAPNMSVCRLPAQPVAGSHSASLIEENYFGLAFENEKGLWLRRIGVPVGADVGIAQKNIQEPVRIVGRTRMEIVIHAAAGG